jgi:hypothetical protein
MKNALKIIPKIYLKIYVLKITNFAILKDTTIHPLYIILFIIIIINAIFVLFTFYICLYVL